MASNILLSSESDSEDDLDTAGIVKADSVSQCIHVRS